MDPDEERDLFRGFFELDDTTETLDAAQAGKNPRLVLFECLAAFDGWLPWKDHPDLRVPYGRNTIPAAELTPILGIPHSTLIRSLDAFKDDSGRPWILTYDSYSRDVLEAVWEDELRGFLEQKESPSELPPGVVRLEKRPEQTNLG